MTSIPEAVFSPITMDAGLFRPTLRLRLKPTAPVTGFVDGAWWPYSRRLGDELPAVLTAVSTRIGRIARVSYELTRWSPAPRRLTIGGYKVRLGGFRSQPADTLAVTATSGERIILLVVPPEFLAGSANRALLTASLPANTDDVAALLAMPDTRPPGGVPAPRTPVETAE